MMRSLAFFIILFICSGFPINADAQYNFNVKRPLSETNHKIVYASYSSDGRYIITAGSDSSIILWNTDRMTIYRTLTGLKARPNMAVISADNQFVLAGGKDNKVSMWNLATLSPVIVKTFEGHKDQVKSLDVSPDGKYLVTGSTDRTIRIWDLESTNLIYELKKHNNDVNSVVFGPNGRILASGGADGEIILWNFENGAVIISQSGHKGWIRDIAFSPDGNLLASCGDDKLIKIWQIPGLKLSGTLAGHKDWVQSIDFSPDGKTLISGGRDNLIILWDVNARKILRQSDKQEQIVTCVDISPIRPDFISACFGSEGLEIWALSGLDETQWKESPYFVNKPKVTDKNIAENQLNVEQEITENKFAPSKGIPVKSPMIEVFSPVPVKGRIVHDKSSVILIGRATDPEGINVLVINKNPVKLSKDGVFQYNMDLTKGENPVSIIAINNNGILNEVTLGIECIAENASVPVPVNISEGNYYALLIGINNYQSSEVLLTKYTFKKDNIIFLKNPTQSEIITTFDDLSGKLTSNDNLLIFYAGHGHWDEKGKVGYWLPSDATRNNTVNWFRNSTLRDFIGSIQTKHTLLIADACFSGAIFKTRALTEASPGIKKLSDLPSRKAMTSGILQVVPDESFFIKYLVKRLSENADEFLTSESLFSSFQTAVMDNSPNIPQFGVIQNVGDEGGDFIFVKQ
jgi:WD40 repeat protein